MSVKDQAICIRAIDYSETSQVVTLFTRGHGKISALAKGTRRPKSAFGGPIEVFSYGDVVFVEPHQGTLAILTELQTQYDVLRALSGNLFALHGCLLAAELLSRLTQDQDPHPSLFDRFIQFARRVSGCEGPRLDRSGILALMVVFQLALLKDIGLGLELEACVNCGRPYARQWPQCYISSAGNGFVCRDCEGSFPDKVRLTEAQTRAMTAPQHLLIADIDTVRGLQEWLLAHFTNLLHHRPRTAAFIMDTL